MRRRTLGFVIVAVVLGIAAFVSLELVRPARVSAREAVLIRQNLALGSLVPEAAAGELLNFRGVLVVVDQTLIQDLINAVVPLEADVGGGFHVRVTHVDSAFGDGVALVRLKGQANLGGASVGTSVTVFAVIDVVKIDPASGILQCDVGILAVEAEDAAALGRVRPFGGGDPVGRLTEALADGGLSLLLGPLEIPVQIEDELSIPAVQSKRLQIPGEEFPLTVSAHRVKVFGGKLWIFVDVALASPPNAGPSSAVSAPTVSAPTAASASPFHANKPQP